MPKLRAQGSYKVTPLAQSNESTCWLACYQMIYQSIDESKETLIERLKKANIDLEVTLKDDQQKLRLGGPAHLFAHRGAVSNPHNYYLG